MGYTDLFGCFFFSFSFELSILRPVVWDCSRVTSGWFRGQFCMWAAGLPDTRHQRLFAANFPRIDRQPACFPDWAISWTLVVDAFLVGLGWDFFFVLAFFFPMLFPLYLEWHDKRGIFLHGQATML